MGTLLIAGLCLALGCILGYAYSPVKGRFFDPLNQETIANETEAVIREWRKVHWTGPDNDTFNPTWKVRHALMEHMLDAIGCEYDRDTR